MDMKKYLQDNMNAFEKVNWLKQLCSEAIGVSDAAVIQRMLSRLRRKGSAELKKSGDYPIFFARRAPPALPQPAD